MVRNITLGALAAMSIAACAADVDDASVSQTTQGSFGTIDGQCIGRCSRITANGYEDAECVADPCLNGECELDSCDEVGLYAANRNTKISTYRCQLGSVMYDAGGGSGMVANCDPDGDGKIGQDKLSLCCTKIEFRPEIYAIGKAFDENYQSGPESFMVPDSLPSNAPYTRNDFCPRTEITQTETTPIHGDATRTSNADACNGKPTLQWMRTEVSWPKEAKYGGLWKETMKCGSDLLSFGVQIFELWTRKAETPLFPKVASVITGGTGALGSCVEMANAIPSTETSNTYVTWEAVSSNGQGQFNDPMFYTMPTNEHYDSDASTWFRQGTHSQTLKACRRHIQGRFMASRLVRLWSFWNGEWKQSDQYRVGLKYFEIPGATFKLEASEPCTCRPDADSFGIDCTGKKTTYAGDGSYLITSDSDSRKCVKHCFQMANCMTYDCSQPEPACPVSDYFFPDSGSGSGFPGYP